MAIVAGLLCATTAHAQERALSFTSAQAAAGQSAYTTHCVTCHGPQLTGPLGKPLKGPEFMQKYGPRYSLFHIKDAPSIPADHDVELGKGVVNFRRILAMIDNVDQKHLYVEQESYPGAPIESVRRDYDYISKLTF